ARPGGDVDVILAFRPIGSSDRRHYAFRRGEYWTQLVGAWAHRYQAIPAAARETQTQVLTHRALIPLLELALNLADFPDAVLASAEHDADEVEQ
ncbi:hypothetical protein, partial [Nonomuraea rubra]|uniref:hypothetical protein n=2 Tax=Streptosporangiaceae TaxID=2004 RepID=UPI0033C8B2E2